MALAGGLAVSCRSEPRFRRDIDLAVAVRDDQEAERLLATLRGRGYRILATVEQDAVGRLATVRLALPGGDPETPVLDLLFASSGIEREVVDSCEELALFPEVIAPVARLEHLLALSAG